MIERGIVAIVILALIAVIFWGGGPNSQFWGDKAITGPVCYMDDGRAGTPVESGVWPFRNEYCKARRNPGPKKP